MSSDPKPPTSNSIDTPPTPLRCLTGAAVSGGLGTALYFLTRSIIDTFAHKPVPTGSPFATNIAIAVRTLVMGLSTLVTALFAIATLGLIALAIQLLIQNGRSPQTGKD
ncbi:MAG: DUF3082 domain-containing protein [Elainellaceae cyanobacterium]